MVCFHMVMMVKESRRGLRATLFSRDSSAFDSRSGDAIVSGLSGHTDEDDR